MKKFILFTLMLMVGLCTIQVSAQTPCNPITITDNAPWLDNFSTFPACWTFPIDNGSSWEWDNVDNYIYHDFGTYECDALSPVLDISGVTLPYLKFSQKRADFAASTMADELYVYFRSTVVGEDSTWILLNTYPAGENQAALFITSDGFTAEYNTTLNAVVTAEKAFYMPESNSIHVEFDVQVGGEGDNTHSPADYLKVFLAPNTVEFTSGATSSNAQSAVSYSTYAFNFSDYLWQTLEYNYPYKLNSTQDSILHISMNVANPDANGEAKIVFLWRNDDYLGTQPSAIIRNFIITGDTTYTPPTPPTPQTCDIPTNVTITNVSEHSAEISWSAGDNETAWNLQYKENSASTWGNSIPVTTTSYQLSGLNPETEYQVRIQANCIDTLSDWTVPVHFTTAEEVGIDNIILTNSISLMPNPADNYIELRVNSNVKVTEAVVYNAFGQMSQTVIVTDNHARIDLSGMAAGIYFVRVNGEGIMATKKFIRK